MDRTPATRATPSIALVAGEVLLTIGVVLALFVVYETFWTNIASGRLQGEATAALQESWDDASTGDASTLPIPPAVPPLGRAFARLHLPTLGDDAAYTVVEGTRNEDLRTGPGHYVETQMPGEPGNAALAGHRNGSGAVFQHLDRLNSCDPIVVETETQWMTYRVVPVEGAAGRVPAATADARGQDPAAAREAATRRESAARCLSPEQVDRFTSGDYAHVLGRQITTPYAVEVIEPLPGAPDSRPREGAETIRPDAAAEPDATGPAAPQPAEATEPAATGPAAPQPAEATEPEATGPAAAEPAERELERMITLTTCNPEYSNAERLIVHAVLTDTTPKSAGMPDALKE